MGLGITKDGIFDIYSIPLVSMQDVEWLDNSWLTEHLRHLAQKIEETNIRIYSVSLEVDCQYKSPKIVVRGFEKTSERETSKPPR